MFDIETEHFGFGLTSIEVEIESAVEYILLAMIFVVGAVDKMKGIQELLQGHEKFVGLEGRLFLQSRAIVVAAEFVPFRIHESLHLYKDIPVLLLITRQHERSTVLHESEISNSFVVLCLCNEIVLFRVDFTHLVDQKHNILHVRVDYFPIRI